MTRGALADELQVLRARACHGRDDEQQGRDVHDRPHRPRAVRDRRVTPARRLHVPRLEAVHAGLIARALIGAAAVAAALAAGASGAAPASHAPAVCPRFDPVFRLEFGSLGRPGHGDQAARALRRRRDERGGRVRRLPGLRLRHADGGESDARLPRDDACAEPDREAAVASLSVSPHRPQRSLPTPSGDLLYPEASADHVTRPAREHRPSCSSAWCPAGSRSR